MRCDTHKALYGSRLRIVGWIVFLAAFPSMAWAQAPARPMQSTADDRREVTITVYNQNFGLVREVRDFRLGRGRIALEFGDVASQIQPETVHIRALGGDALSILEQNYRYDLLSPQKLLEKYVGRMVKVYRYNSATGQEQEYEAEVLSVNQGTILRIGDEITYNFPGRFSFPQIPDNPGASR